MVVVNTSGGNANFWRHFVLYHAPGRFYGGNRGTLNYVPARIRATGGFFAGWPGRPTLDANRGAPVEVVKCQRLAE